MQKPCAKREKGQSEPVAGVESKWKQGGRQGDVAAGARGPAGSAAGRGVWILSQAQVIQGYSHGARGMFLEMSSFLLSPIRLWELDLRYRLYAAARQRRRLHLSLMCLLLMMKTWVLNVNLWQVRRDHDAKKPDLESSAFHRHDGEWVGPMLQTLKEGAHRPTHGIYFEGSQKSLQAEWKKPRVGDGEDAGHRQQLRHRWSWRARVEGRVRWVLYNISVRTIIKGHL